MVRLSTTQEMGELRDHGFTILDEMVGVTEPEVDGGDMNAAEFICTYRFASPSAVPLEKLLPQSC